METLNDSCWRSFCCDTFSLQSISKGYMVFIHIQWICVFCVCFCHVACLFCLRGHTRNGKAKHGFCLTIFLLVSNGIAHAHTTWCSCPEIRKNRNEMKSTKWRQAQRIFFVWCVSIRSIHFGWFVLKICVWLAPNVTAYECLCVTLIAYTSC